MLIPIEWIAMIGVLLIGGLSWYLGYVSGIVRGAEGMFEELEKDDYLRTRDVYTTDGVWEKELIEPHWKKDPN